jgi:hypothetical protein
LIAIASIWIRFVPRYTVKRRLPAKIPIDNPGNVTPRLPPSVVTVQDDVLNDATARRISSGLRGKPYTRSPGPSGMTPGGSGAAGAAAAPWARPA